MSFARAMTRGFTLIEMAIVLVVIGLLLSGGLLSVAPILESSRVKDTKSKLDDIESALLVYAIQNNCLPCPATATTAIGGANVGQSLPQPLDANNCSTGACTNARGVVPWITLGLSEADVTDAWGMRISYAITAGLQTNGNMDRDGSDYTPLGTLQVSNLNAPAASDVTAAAAYVLVSHGPDRAFAYAASTGTVQTDPHGSAATDPQGRNAVTSNANFIQDDVRPVAGVGYFDDIVRWRTKPLFVQQCGSGACGNP